MKDRQGWIYVLHCLINGKEYVGQTVCGILNRMKGHIYAAYVKKDKRPLYRAMRKYRLKSFVVTELWTGPQSKLNAAEKRFVRQRKTFIDTGWGYNLTTGGGQHAVSKRTRKLLSLAHKGIPLSESHRSALAAINRDPKRRAARSAALKFRLSTPAARAEISRVALEVYAEDPILREQLRAAANAAYARDPTLRKRLSAIQKVVQNKPTTVAKHKAAHEGKKLTPAHAKAISKSLLGHSVSNKTRTAISLANKGSKRSPEVCALFSTLQKAMWNDSDLRARQSASHSHPWTAKRRASYEASRKLRRKG